MPSSLESKSASINPYPTKLRDVATKLRACGQDSKMEDPERRDGSSGYTSSYPPARLVLAGAPIDISSKTPHQDMKEMFVKYSNHIMVAIGNVQPDRDFYDYTGQNWSDHQLKIENDTFQSTPQQSAGKVKRYDVSVTNVDQDIKADASVVHIRVLDMWPAYLRPEEASLVVQVMMDYLSSNKTLFIHCAGGIGRTGNIFMAILAVLLTAYPNTAKKMFPNLEPITDTDSLYTALVYVRTHIRSALAPTTGQLQDACKLAALMLDELAAKTEEQKEWVLAELPTSLAELRAILATSFQKHQVIPSTLFQQLQQQAQKLIAGIELLHFAPAIKDESIRFSRFESTFKKLEDAREIIRLFRLLGEFSPEQNIQDLENFFANKMHEFLQDITCQVLPLIKEYYCSWYDGTHFNHSIVGPFIKALSSLTTELTQCYDLPENTQPLIHQLQDAVRTLNFLYSKEETKDEKTRLSHLSYSLKEEMDYYEAQLTHLTYSLEAIQKLAKKPKNKTQFLSKVEKLLNKKPEYLPIYNKEQREKLQAFNEKLRKFKEKIFPSYAFVQSAWTLFKTRRDDFELRSYSSACFRQFIFPLLLTVGIMLTLVAPMIPPFISSLVFYVTMIGSAIVVCPFNSRVGAPALLVLWDKAHACLQFNPKTTIFSGITGLGLGIAVGLLLGVFFPPAWLANLYLLGKIGVLVALAVNIQILTAIFTYKITTCFQNCFDNTQEAIPSQRTTENSQPYHALAGEEKEAPVSLLSSNNPPHPIQWSPSRKDANPASVSTTLTSPRESGSLSQGSNELIIQPPSYSATTV